MDTDFLKIVNELHNGGKKRKKVKGKKSRSSY